MTNRKPTKSNWMFLLLAGFVFSMGLAQSAPNGVFNRITANGPINIGGIPSGFVFHFENLSTIPATWIFDYTSPQTALASVLQGSTTGTGNVVLAASPTLTGTPLAPTAAPGTNTTQIATMAALFAATGGTSQTCNSNGCYKIFSDGTILEWGETGSCGSGTNACTVGITFPSAFTSSTNLRVSLASENNVSGATGNVLPTLNGEPTTTGFNTYFAALVYVGGSGNNLSGTQMAHWIAVGH
jgi:hypothetical protein